MAIRPETEAAAGPAGKPLDLDTARAAILRDVVALPETETLQVNESLGRVLAEPLVSGIDVPDFDNSAMDG